MARYYGWITTAGKTILKGFQGGNTKEGEPGPKPGSDDSDTEDAVHWTCACQQVHYPDNSHAAHDTRLLILFAIHVLRQPPTTGIKIVPCPATTPHDSLADSPPVR